MRVFFRTGSSAVIKFGFAAFVLATCGCGSNTGNSSAGGTGDSVARGRQIVDEYLKRDASPYRKSRINIAVTSEGEAPKTYQIESTRKQTPEQTMTLTQIVSPPDEAASSLATEVIGKKTIVTTYSASANDFRDTDSKKMFIGGLTAGELLGDWDKFNYQLVSEKNLDGVKTLEVEGRLKPDADSVVSRMNVIFRADDYVPVESHQFGADGKELRAYKTAVVKSDPAHPYASRVEIDNRVYKAHITIEILSQEYPEKIDDAMFAKEKLKEPVKK
ncbi:MAG: outer membrane lipoprotein-sorting protein [Acidobacteriota bacterium]